MVKFSVAFMLTLLLCSYFAHPPTVAIVGRSLPPDSHHDASALQQTVTSKIGRMIGSGGLCIMGLNRKMRKQLDITRTDLHILMTKPTILYATLYN